MSKPLQLSQAEQQTLLDNAIHVIRAESHHMRKALESKHKFMDSLKHASNFLNELRTTSLNPKQYYELYILTYDSLSYLSAYLKDNTISNSSTKSESTSNTSTSATATTTNKNSSYLIDLYELVQYAGNIIPRLYLMITIGTVYMGSNDAPINEILNDMLEMCKGVQHPIRGLFLRYYLIQNTKSYLIQQGNVTENKEILPKIVSFIISNFIEMNKLWVRLQFQGHTSEREKRISERNELKILVGSNLVILSQLDSIDIDYYNTYILPQLLNQIVKCNDSIAQNYLLDVIIQIFPDNFQIKSLDLFLDALLKIHSNINMSTLFVSLVNRFTNYKKRNMEFTTKAESKTEPDSKPESKPEPESKSEPESKPETEYNIGYDFFNTLINFVDNINNAIPDYNMKDYSQILNSLLDLTLVFNDDNLSDNLNTIYKLAIDKIELLPSNQSSQSIHLNSLLKSIEKFPSTTTSSMLLSFNDENYFKLFKLQNSTTKIDICTSIISNLIDNNIKIKSIEDLDNVIKYIDNSLTQIDENASLTKEDLFGKQSINPQFYDTLNSFVHVIKNDDVLINKMLILHFNDSISTNEFTISTTISVLIRITRTMKYKKIENIELIKTFNTISKLINQISATNPINALNYNLICAQLSNECNFSNLTYDFFIESFLVYEELIVESKLQFQSLMNIINKLYSMDNLILNNIEDFDKLIVKVTLYGSRLMKKTDQCRAIYNSSHLWWINKIETTQDDNDSDGDDDNETQITLKRDDKRVLECLQKSLRIADSIMDIDVSIELFVEILNQSIYYFIHGNEIINTRYINGLIELISNNFKELTSTNKTGAKSKTTSSSPDNNSGDTDTTWRHFQRTLLYIRDQRAVDARFHEIALVD